MLLGAAIGAASVAMWRNWPSSYEQCVVDELRALRGAPAGAGGAARALCEKRYPPKSAADTPPWELFGNRPKTDFSSQSR